MSADNGLTAADEFRAALDQFNGSEHFYRHGICRNVMFTDGAKFVADRAGAYWLLDEIALAQRTKAVGTEEFQAWKLAVQPDHHATLTCDDGNGNIVFTKEIEFTDFPLDEFAIWFENSTIYLPGER
jgi:hypothetical protein